MEYYSTTTEMTILMEPQESGIYGNGESYSIKPHDNLLSYNNSFGNISVRRDFHNLNQSENYLFSAEDVSHLLNITRSAPIQYAMLMYGYIMPFLLIITIIANTLIVLVLSQKHMRTPTNLVLLSMAIADLLTLLFPSPWYFYMYTLGNHWKVLYPPLACYAFTLMQEVIPAFFHTASIWLTLLLAGQRYIYVCHPTAAKTWCTVPRVIRAIIIVFVLALGSQLTRFFDRSYVSVEFLWNGAPHWGCQIYSAPWVMEIISENIYYPLYFGFRIIFINIGPCAALVVLNVLLFRALKEAQIKRQKLFKENRKSESKKLRDSNSTTIMLIVVVTVFLLVEIPLAIATLIHVMQAALEILIVEYEYINITILMTNFFIILSYPVNFAIYCGMSRQFRETFTELFVQRFMGERTGTSFSVVTTATNL